MNNAVKVGEKEYALSPLTIGESRRSREMAVKFRQADPAAQAALAEEFNALVFQLVLASMRRVDPSITAEQIENSWTNLDLMEAWQKLAALSTPQIPVLRVN